MTNKILTESIRDIAETVGVELAAALVEHFGGTRLYVPARLKSHHDIAKLLPDHHAEALVGAYGGQQIDVPMHLFNETLARCRLVHELSSKRFTVRDIARRAGCTERHVYRILEEMNSTPSLL